jgi:hypothetical protein
MTAAPAVSLSPQLPSRHRDTGSRLANNDDSVHDQQGSFSNQHVVGHAEQRESRAHYIDRHLRDLYFNLERATAYSSIASLIAAAEPLGITQTEVRQWLHSQEVFTRFHRARKKFPTNFYNIRALNSVYEADLNDMSKFAEFNDNFKWFLCVICCMSRRVWAVPLKGKTSSEISRAFDHLFSSGVKCRLLQSDHEKGFMGPDMRRVLSKHNVRLRMLENEGHARMVERVNQTLKHPLWKHMYRTNSWRWIEPLKQIVFNYNRTPHSSICGMKPINVTEKDVFRLWSSNYLKHMKKAGLLSKGSRLSQSSSTSSLRKSERFKVNDYVRVSLLKNGAFEKGYTPRFSQQMYKISGIFKFQPYSMFTLSRLDGIPVQGYWYAEELLKVTPPTADTVYRVEKILDRRKRAGARGREEVLVRWQGYDSSFDSWEPASSLTSI